MKVKITLWGRLIITSRNMVNGFYWITIMGDPFRKTEPWGWQMDGHHLIINLFWFLGDQGRK